MIPMIESRIRVHSEITILIHRKEPFHVERWSFSNVIRVTFKYVSGGCKDKNGTYFPLQHMGGFVCDEVGEWTLFSIIHPTFGWDDGIL